MRIILAEDDKNFGLVLKEELEEDGYRIDLVTDGVDAVLNFVDKKHDFVLLDIRMPVLDGISTLRIIKKIDPQVSVITFSGVAGTGEMAESARFGVIRCLTKPFEILELKEEIKKHISSPSNN